MAPPALATRMTKVFKSIKISLQNVTTKPTQKEYQLLRGLRDVQGFVGRGIRDEGKRV
jgi:hypothetical protein